MSTPTPATTTVAIPLFDRFMLRAMPQVHWPISHKQ